VTAHQIGQVIGSDAFRIEYKGSAVIDTSVANCTTSGPILWNALLSQLIARRQMQMMQKLAYADDHFHDECGVFGVFGHEEASKLTYLGLYALQHRGQESLESSPAMARSCICIARWVKWKKSLTPPVLTNLPGISLSATHAFHRR